MAHLLQCCENVFHDQHNIYTCTRRMAFCWNMEQWFFLRCGHTLSKHVRTHTHTHTLIYISLSSSIDFRWFIHGWSKRDACSCLDHVTAEKNVKKLICLSVCVVKRTLFKSLKKVSIWKIQFDILQCDTRNLYITIDKKSNCRHLISFDFVKFHSFIGSFILAHKGKCFTREKKTRKKGNGNRGEIWDSLFNQSNRERKSKRNEQ